MAGHSSITDPSVAFIGPRAAIGNAPFTAGQKFATNLNRSQNIEKFLQAIGGNNQLRAMLAQRLAQMEGQQQRFTDITSNAEQLAGVGGRPFVLDMLNQPTTGFSTQADELTLRGQQAGNLADLGSGVQALRAGGLSSTVSEGAQASAGVALRPVDPTSVEAQKSAAIELRNIPLGSGAGSFNVDVSPDSPLVKGDLQRLGLTGQDQGQLTLGAGRVTDTLKSLSGIGVIEADEPVEPRPENTEAQINAVNRTVKSIKVSDSFKDRNIVVRHGENGNLVIMVTDPDQVLRTVDRQGATVNE